MQIVCEWVYLLLYLYFCVFVYSVGFSFSKLCKVFVPCVGKHNVYVKWVVNDDFIEEQEDDFIGEQEDRVYVKPRQ